MEAILAFVLGWFVFSTFGQSLLAGWFGPSA